MHGGGTRGVGTRHDICERAAPAQHPAAHQYQVGGSDVTGEASKDVEQGRRAAEKQRRGLRHLQRSQKHRTADEAQRKRPRLPALQHRFLAERVDGGGDVGVLLHRPAWVGNRAVERAEQHSPAVKQR